MWLTGHGKCNNTCHEFTNQDHSYVILRAICKDIHGLGEREREKEMGMIEIGTVTQNDIELP